jgi:hypothetical protein
LQRGLGGGVQRVEEPVAGVVLRLLWGLSLVVAEQQIDTVLLLPHMVAMHLLAALLQLFLAKTDEKINHLSFSYFLTFDCA